MSYIDFHSHILAKTDDGPSDFGTSVSMIKMLKKQNVSQICFTPHYDFEKESPDDFLKRRSENIEILKSILERENIDIRIYAGAEVAVKHDLSDVSGIEKLCYTFGDNKRFMLFELPLMLPYNEYLTNEICSVASMHSITPIIAHFDRYFSFYSKESLNEVTDIPDVILQFNNESLSSFTSRRKILRYFNSGYPVVFGSDCHNMTSRKPNFDLFEKKVISKLSSSKANRLLMYGQFITLY